MPLTGYNEVVRIPSGATNIDVRQHSYSGRSDDDNYLGETFIVSGPGAEVSVLFVLFSVFSNHLSAWITNLRRWRVRVNTNMSVS